MNPLRSLLERIVPPRVVEVSRVVEVPVPGPPREVRVRAGRPRSGWSSGGLYPGAETNRLTGPWATVPVSIDDVVRMNHRPLKARSREECRRNPHARKFLLMVERNVVGQGIRLQARAKNPAGDRDAAANAGLEEHWRLWGKAGSGCTLDGTAGWTETLRLVVRTLATDGEVLARLVRGPGVNPYGFAVQLLDTELLDVEHNAELPGGAYIRFGIEFDALGRRLAYHLRRGSAVTYARDTVRVPASEILHVYLREAVGQKRGMPWLATALWDLHGLGAYKEAVITNARAGASKTGFYEQNPEMTDEEYEGDREDDDGNFEEDIEPLTVRKLPAGYKFVPFTPEYPNGEYPRFVKAGLQTIAAGLGVAYHDLAQDLEGVNYSSIRSGIQAERDGWLDLQDFVVDHFIAPIYAGWLRMGLLTGAISTFTPEGLPAGPLAIAKEAKYLRVLWQPRRWDWVDPLRDATAVKLEVDANVESLSGWARRRGRDLEDVLEEIAADRKLLASFGLQQTAPAPPGPPPPADDDEGKGKDKDEDDEGRLLALLARRNGGPTG